MERIVYDRWRSTAALVVSGQAGDTADLIERDPPLAGTPLHPSRIGCGTGHNIVMLKRFGRVDAIEIDPAARPSPQRVGHPVMDSPLARADRVEDRAYYLVALLDLLELSRSTGGAESISPASFRPGGRS